MKMYYVYQDEKYESKKIAGECVLHLVLENLSYHRKKLRFLCRKITAQQSRKVSFAILLFFLAVSPHLPLSSHLHHVDDG